MVEQRLFAERETLHAPHLLDVEVAQVVRRYIGRGMMDSARGREVIQDLLAFPIQRYPYDVLLPRVYDLRDNLTAYDAVRIVPRTPSASPPRPVAGTPDTERPAHKPANPGPSASGRTHGRQICDHRFVPRAMQSPA